MLQVFQRHIASVCSKRFICFRRMLQAFLSGCCICFTHMLQEYVRNASAVSILRCNKCFYVASVLSGCCICFIHMFVSVCSKCFICFRRMLHSNVSCCKCFVFQTYVQRLIGARRAEGRRMGHATCLGSCVDGACSSSCRLLGPARAEREEGFRGKERRARSGDDSGRLRVRGRTRQTGNDCTVGLWHVSDGLLGTVRRNLSHRTSGRQQFPNQKRARFTPQQLPIKRA
jgi:hypothetical protein